MLVDASSGEFYDFFVFPKFGDLNLGGDGITEEHRGGEAQVLTQIDGAGTGQPVGNHRGDQSGGQYSVDHPRAEDGFFRTHHLSGWGWNPD